MRRVLVLQHADWELPGTYGDLLAERNAQVHVARPDHDEPLPDWRWFDAIVAMGGPMSANDDVRLPWLIDEKRLVAAAVAADKPFFGTCLGAQLLASALGGKVYPGPHPEYGMHRIHTAPAARTDPVFADLPAEIDVFQWHGETFDLPPAAVSLAESPGYPNQAIRANTMAYGLQFHLEVSADLLAKWLAVPSCLQEATITLGPTAEEVLTSELGPAEAGLLALARSVFTRWLDLAGV